MSSHEEENCSCIICQLQKNGMSKEEIIEKIKAWEKEKFEAQGWYIHSVNDDPKYPFEFNAHTHGLEESFNHRDLQLVCPLSKEAVSKIFSNVVDRIKNGEKFKSGDVVSKIIGNNFDVKFIEAKENDRVVLRIIVPDNKNNLEFDQMKDDFHKQYLDIFDVN